MLPFRRSFAIGCIRMFAVISLIMMLAMMDASAASFSPVALSDTEPANADDINRLPDWLLRLELNAAQVHRVFEIDALLEQQLELILTSRQYSQWQSSQAILSTQSWNFQDLNIDLSPYQQAAVDTSFHSAMQSLLTMLSLEQKQQLMQYLSDETNLPESNFETEFEI